MLTGEWWMNGERFMYCALITFDLTALFVYFSMFSWRYFHYHPGSMRRTSETWIWRHVNDILSSFFSRHWWRTWKTAGVDCWKHYKLHHIWMSCACTFFYCYCCKQLELSALFSLIIALRHCCWHFMNEANEMYEEGNGLYNESKVAFYVSLKISFNDCSKRFKSVLLVGIKFLRSFFLLLHLLLSGNDLL